MNNDEIVIRQSIVNKVFEVAQACVDEKRKGWRVKMQDFWNAMDDLGFTGKEVREALTYCSARMYLIAFRGEDGNVAGISLVPQRYRCWHCNMPLEMQDDPEDHIDLCLRRQKKIERNRKLV